MTKRSLRHVDLRKSTSDFHKILLKCVFYEEYEKSVELILIKLIFTEKIDFFMLFSHCKLHFLDFFFILQKIHASIFLISDRTIRVVSQSREIKDVRAIFRGKIDLFCPFKVLEV